jgi:hypothetical protein
LLAGLILYSNWNGEIEMWSGSNITGVQADYYAKLRDEGKLCRNCGNENCTCVRINQDGNEFYQDGKVLFQSMLSKNDHDMDGAIEARKEFAAWMKEKHPNTIYKFVGP